MALLVNPWTGYALASDLCMQNAAGRPLFFSIPQAAEKVFKHFLFWMST